MRFFLPDLIVNKIWGKSVPEPTSGDDGKAIVYDSDTSSFVLAAAGTPTYIFNLKPAVNAAVNKLDIFTKSGGAAPDASNPIGIMIPDGNGNTYRIATEAAQIIMADAANYWSKGNLDGEIKTAWLYAAWSTADSKLIWMLRGYSGFNMVSTSTTATDDDHCLLPDGSTYSRAATDFCVAVAKIRYQYDTSDTPDHTIQASGENAPLITWNPKSDYGYIKTLETSNTQGSDINMCSVVSLVAKQSGYSSIYGQILGYCVGGSCTAYAVIRVGSSTYTSATIISNAITQTLTANYNTQCSLFANIYLNAGDTIHLGLGLTGASGNRIIKGDDVSKGATALCFFKND